MAKTKTLLLLVVVTAIALAGAFYIQPSEKTGAAQGDPLFPGLIDKVNDVAIIETKSNDAELTITKSGDEWVVQDKSNHPAEAKEVRDVLVGAAELVRHEAKTAKPENFARLEVDDPGEAAESIRYVFKTSSGESMAELIVGKRRLVSSNNNKDQYYVRVPSEGRAWMVEGKIPKHRIASDWLRSEVLRIPNERIHRTTVIHKDGEMTRAIRSRPGLADFTLLGVPDGKEVENDYNVHSFATTLTDLAMNDVTTVDKVTAVDDGSSLVMETFDGLRITVNFATLGKDTYMTFSATQDDTLPKLLGVVAGSSTDGDDELTAKAKATLKSADDVAKEVDALNERWKGWAYRAPSYHLSSVQKKVGELVKDKAPAKSQKSIGPQLPSTSN